jgi:hypothetical protein
MPALALPAGAQAKVVLGRSRDCEWLRETEVRPGDRLSLGEMSFRLVLRRLSS